MWKNTTLQSDPVWEESCGNIRSHIRLWVSLAKERQTEPKWIVMSVNLLSWRPIETDLRIFIRLLWALGWADNDRGQFWSRSSLPATLWSSSVYIHQSCRWYDVMWCSDVAFMDTSVSTSRLVTKQDLTELTGGMNVPILISEWKSLRATRREGGRKWGRWPTSSSAMVLLSQGL